MGLCQVCVRSLQGKSVTEDWFGHHLTLKSFISAAEQGCYFCGRFWAYLSDSQESLKELQALEQVDDILSNSSLNCHKTLCTFMILEPGDLSPLLLMIKLNRDNSLVQPVATKTFTYPLRLSQSINLTKYTFGTLPNSWDEALSLGERWIYECKNKHLRCNNTTSPGNKLPTRLIDIGPIKAGALLVRIVNGNEIQENESYCTLSHCWGKAKFLRLTLRNLPDLMKGFSVASLPLTFRDAIQVVQRLKIRYLWIDSLCIIQDGDDGRDWREEARKMQEVYSNSFCNLSAAAATDSSEGLFSTRLPCFYERTEVDLEDTGKDSRQTKSRWTLSDIRMWEIELLNQPLNIRAWVLQERLLSPRILHFSRHQLIWECLTKDACEAFPDGIPPFRSWYDAPDLKKLEYTEEMKKGRMINGWSQDEKYSQHHVWSDIVRRYCKCFLTFQTDKMLALAGIAQHMKPRVQDDYVAGMWLRYLASELVWSVVESPGPSLRTEFFLGITSSWSAYLIRRP
ncbi:HET-domain-containing protein [Acephala macrosclerotiorum]|nr:HET-domain-containing protein [Acephala macrosclerotiorum]